MMALAGTSHPWRFGDLLDDLVDSPDLGGPIGSLRVSGLGRDSRAFIPGFLAALSSLDSAARACAGLRGVPGRKVHFSDRAQVVEALREWREGHH